MTASTREATDGVTEWEETEVNLPDRDGGLADWQTAYLAEGWTTQIDLEERSDPDDTSTREFGGSIPDA